MNQIEKLLEAINETLDELQAHPMFIGYDASEDEIDSEGGDAAFITVIAQRLNNALSKARR